MFCAAAVFELGLRKHAFVLSVKVLGGLVLDPARADNHDTVLVLLLACRCLNHGLVVSYVAFDILYVGGGEELEVGLCLHLRDSLFKQFLRVFAGECKADMSQVSAQFFLALDERDLESLPRDSERGSHAGNTAAYHKRLLRKRERQALKRLKQVGLVYGHRNELLGLLRGLRGHGRMDP